MQVQQRQQTYKQTSFIIKPALQVSALYAE